LRALKYLLLSFFVFIGAGMPAAAIDDFMHTPYGILADVKMLDFFRNLGIVSAIILAILILASVFVQNFWCRYLCPYGALTGLVALASPMRIQRSAVSCIDCGKCARACPSRLPVDRLIQIRSAECTGCMECVSSCPVESAIALKATSRKINGESFALAICLIFVAVIVIAKVTGHWSGDIPMKAYEQWVPIARDFSH
jgi:polyferredoxin